MAKRSTVPYDIVTSSNMQRFPAFDSSYSLNMYPFVDPEKQMQVMYPYMGSQLQFYFDVGLNNFTGRPGGIISTESQAFAIIGNIFFMVDLTFTPSIIGTINTTTGPVKMDLVGIYLTIVEGSGKWSYNITTGSFNPITDINAPISPTYSVEQAGYIFMNDSSLDERQTMYESKQFDPTTWAATNTTQVNFNSSIYSFPLLAMESINGRVFAMTSGFIQVYENAGKAGFSFRADENLIFEYGILAASPVAKGTGGNKGQTEPGFIIFVSRNIDGVIKVMMTNGNPPIVISTPSIEWRLNQLTNPLDGVGFIIGDNGQTFYELSFTEDNVTFCYHINSEKWIDLSTGNDRHFVEAFTFFNGKRLALSYKDAGLYFMSENYVTDSGQTIFRDMIFKNYRIQGYRLFNVDLAWLYMQQGVGLPGGVDQNNPTFVNGASAEVMVYMSQNGGQTFNQPQIVSAGATGRLDHVTKIEGIGVTRDLTFRIRVEQPIHVAIFGCYLDITPSEGTQ